MDFWASNALPILLILPPVLAVLATMYFVHADRARADKANADKSGTDIVKTWGCLTVVLYPVVFLVLAVLIFFTGLLSRK